MKRLVSVALFLLFSGFLWAQEVPTMSCQFSDFIYVSYESPGSSQKTEINQKMKIVLGRTDEATLRLDGSLRATNSTTWTNITPKGWDTWQSTFLGDFGEILVISHDLGANKKPLHGRFKASLISSNASSASISLGSCLVE